MDLWDNIKHTNIHIIRISEGEEREKGTEDLFEQIMAENFPYLKEKTESSYRKHRVPKKMNPKSSTPRHVIIKMAKVKDKGKILKVREKQLIIYKGNPIRLLADFPAETLQAIRVWWDIFKVLKGKNFL